MVWSIALCHSQAHTIQFPVPGVYVMLVQALLKAGGWRLALCCLLMLPPKCSAAAASMPPSLNAGGLPQHA
eukprot:scaffold92479_cov26-Tisochrysis_lutea.AAC.3